MSQNASYPRQPVTPEQIDVYLQRIQTGPCFTCGIVSGNADGNHLIYQDDAAIVFLNKYPTLYGYMLVAPRQHREQVTSDFTLDEYLALQRIIYRVSEALRRVTPTERVYILSLGSQQGNCHVHWHVAPLPPGVPFREQQFEALQARKGILQIPEEELIALAARIRQAMGEIEN